MPYQEDESLCPFPVQTESLLGVLCGVVNLLQQLGGVTESLLGVLRGVLNLLQKTGGVPPHLL